MKKIFFAAFAALFVFASCNTDSAKQKNLAAADAISKAFTTGNVNAIDSFVSDDFMDHGDRGDVKGKDSLKAMVKFTHENMKDMKQEMIHELADDDYVFTWMRWTGTSNGAGGMPGGPYDFHAMEMSKFKDGKAIEHWTYVDAKEMMKMMAPPPKDTSKMK